MGLLKRPYSPTMAKGSIEQVGNGFRAKVYAGINPITKRQMYLNGPVRPDETTAAMDTSDLLRRAEAGRDPGRSATVNDMFERWLSVTEHEISTEESHRGYIRRVFTDTIGDMPLRKLQERVDILESLYAELRKCSQLCGGKSGLVDHRTTRPHECQPLNKDGSPKRGIRPCAPHACRPLSPSSIRRANAVLSAAYNRAVAWRWADRNPADTEVVQLPKQKGRKRAKPQSAEQVAALINLAFEELPEFGFYLWLAATTGARRGEITALRWSDVDLDHGLLLIDENYVVRQGQRVLKDTKTDEDRPMSIDSLTVLFFTDFKKTQRDRLAAIGEELPDEAFVFSPEPDGSRPYNPDTFTHRYERLAKRLSILEPLKNLRHYNATTLMASGVDLRTTAGRLGHSDGGTTLRHYADWIRPADQRAAELIANDLDRMRTAVRDSQPAGVSFAAQPRLSKVDPVVTAITDAIVRGEYVTGDQLPSLKALGEAHGVSYGTAQLAVAKLAQNGLVTVVRGQRATVV
jgi:integrase